MDSFYFGGPYAITALWSGDRVSSDYFFSLPKDIQRGINERANQIHSAEDLRRMAEFLSKKA